MAVLIPTEFATLRQKMAERVSSITYTKPQADAALQAVENWFEANRASIASAIESATPGVFSAAQKKTLVAAWLLHKFGKEF